jgi:hypothetical protein
MITVAVSQHASPMASPAWIAIRSPTVVMKAGVTVVPVATCVPPRSTCRRIGVAVAPTLTRQFVITPDVVAGTPSCVTVHTAAQSGGVVSGAAVNGLPIVTAARAGEAAIRPVKARTSAIRATAIARLHAMLASSCSPSSTRIRCRSSC